jgi:4-amino-4-deoxychorismate lyase
MPPVAEDRVVAVLGRGVIPADTPILRADDLGALRGDGIFETIHVRHGRPWLLDAHLTRMAASAARLGLTLPARERLADLVDEAARAWPADLEGALRLICTRGPEAGIGPVTVFATVSPVAEAHRRARHEGIAVLTASLGFDADARDRAPWLLPGAKTLSYAVNMASLRWAQAAGGDDVLWVSADGYALEGPTSTLVWLDGTTLCTVPTERTGILAGTTARHLLDRAGELNWSVDERMVRPAELLAAAGAWFTSSVRGVAPVRSLDGTAVPFPTDVTARLRTLLGFA